MSRFTKTVRFPIGAMGNTADYVNNTMTLVGTTPIRIPENEDATKVVRFKDAMVFLNFNDTFLAAGSYTYINVNVAISTANTLWTEPDDLTNTGENFSGVLGPINALAQFTSNWGGGGTTTNNFTTYAMFQAGSAPPVAGVVRGVSGWLDLTYEYDDTYTAAASRKFMKTICYPLSEISGALTTTANTRTANIPRLHGGIASGALLPETGANVQQAWVVIRGNDNNNGTASHHYIRYNVDNGAPNNLPMVNSALASDNFHQYQINWMNFGSLDANANISFFGSLATRWHNMVADLWVTYEFDANSNSTINYVELPFAIPSRQLNGLVTTTANSRVDFDLRIPEPGVITLKRGAIELGMTSAAAGNLQIRLGSWAAGQWKHFPWTAASCTAGQLVCQTRFDTDSEKGLGYTLHQGKNAVVADFHLVTGTVGTLSGKMKLLYTSNTSNSGIARHSRTIRKLVRQIDLATTSDTLYTANVQLGLADDPNGTWYNHIALHYYMWPSASATGIFPMLQVFNGENKNQGWLETFSDLSAQDAELTYADYYVDFTATLNRIAFNRWVNGSDYDFDTSRLRSNTTAPRAFRTVFTTTATRFGAAVYITLHNCLSQWKGNISNSAGGNVTIWLHDAETGEAIYRGFRDGNGEYTITTFNSNVKLFAQAYENGNYKGRSNVAYSSELGI